jgi:uncharacterized delta-60 repeat protein
MSRTRWPGRWVWIGSALAAVVLLSGSAASGTGAGLDPTFAQGGTVVTDMGGTDDSARGLAVGGDGSITVVGEARRDDQSLRSFAIVRYTAEGTLDPAFGDGGRVHTAFGEFQGSGAHAAALQPDGRLVVAGFGRHPELFHDTFAVARYDADGSLDPTFGEGHGVLVAIDSQTGAGRNDIANAVAVDAEGRIVVAGETGDLFKDFAVARLRSDGTLDPGFGEGGIVATDLGGDDRANAIAIQPDGSILVAGSGWQDEGNENLALVRYLSDGTLDPGFGNLGIVTTDIRGGSDRAYGVAVRTDGAIVLGGVTQVAGGCSPNACERYGYGMAQFAADGTPDSSFADKGTLSLDFITSSGAYGLALTQDGTAVLGGHIGNEDFGLAFIAPDGGPVPVGGGDAVRIDVGGGTDRAFGVAVAPDGSIVLAGDAADSAGAVDFAVARYRLTGR